MLWLGCFVVFWRGESASEIPAYPTLTYGYILPLYAASERGAPAGPGENGSMMAKMIQY